MCAAGELVCVYADIRAAVARTAADFPLDAAIIHMEGLLPFYMRAERERGNPNGARGADALFELFAGAILHGNAGKRDFKFSFEFN